MLKPRRPPAVRSHSAHSPAAGCRPDDRPAESSVSGNGEGHDDVNPNEWNRSRGVRLSFVEVHLTRSLCRAAENMALGCGITFAPAAHRLEKRAARSFPPVRPFDCQVSRSCVRTCSAGQPCRRSRNGRPCRRPPEGQRSRASRRSAHGCRSVPAPDSCRARPDHAPAR